MKANAKAHGKGQTAVGQQHVGRAKTQPEPIDGNTLDPGVLLCMVGPVKHHGDHRR